MIELSPEAVERAAAAIYKLHSPEEGSNGQWAGNETIAEAALRAALEVKDAE